MNDTLEIDIMDGLPIGIMAVRGDAIELMNQTVRALFAGEFASLNVLIEASPGGAGLATVLRNGSAWINLSDTLFHGRALELDRERTLILLFPLAFMDPQDPQLRELRERHGDFQEIFHNCFDGIYVADGAGRTLWMNEGFERAYGFTRHFSGPIMERMLSHAWPGNVRELRNIVERLAVTTSADEIGPVAWPPEIAAEPSPRDATKLKTTRVAHEVEAVRAAVERLGSIGRAAAHLGVSASTVKRRLRHGRQIIRH